MSKEEVFPLICCLILTGLLIFCSISNSKLQDKYAALELKYDNKVNQLTRECDRNVDLRMCYSDVVRENKELFGEVKELRGKVKQLEVNPTTKFKDVQLTAYCPCEKCCDQWADGITKTGTKATAGRTIAVDPNVIQLGSKVEINGKTYVAEDIGGAIDGLHIDVFFNTHKEAEAFGVQTADVIVKGGKND